MNTASAATGIEAALHGRKIEVFDAGCLKQADPNCRWETEQRYTVYCDRSQDQISAYRAKHDRVLVGYDQALAAGDESDAADHAGAGALVFDTHPGERRDLEEVRALIQQQLDSLAGQQTAAFDMPFRVLLAAAFGGFPQLFLQLGDSLRHPGIIRFVRLRFRIDGGSETLHPNYSSRKARHASDIRPSQHFGPGSRVLQPSLLNNTPASDALANAISAAEYAPRVHLGLLRADLPVGSCNPARVPACALRDYRFRELQSSLRRADAG